MDFLLAIAGVVVLAVVFAFWYVIQINFLVSKKQAISKFFEPMLDWQIEAHRSERVVQALLTELEIDSDFSATPLSKTETDKQKGEPELWQETLNQKQNLEKILELSDKHLVLLKNDDFFTEEKNAKKLILAYAGLVEDRQTKIELYNKALEKSPVRVFSGMKLVK